VDAKTNGSGFSRRSPGSLTARGATAPRAPGPSSLGIRIGLDLGSNFIHVAAWDELEGLVARTRVPTGSSRAQVLSDVGRALGSVIQTVREAGFGPVRLVAYCSTRPLGEILQGDTSPIGILFIRRKSLIARIASAGAAAGPVRLGGSSTLRLIREHLAVEGDPDEFKVREAIYVLLLKGARSICVDAAPGLGDRRYQQLALRIAADMGVPASIAPQGSSTSRHAREAVFIASVATRAACLADAVEVAVQGLLPDVPQFRMGRDGVATSATSAVAESPDALSGGIASPVVGILRGESVGNAVVIDAGATTTKVCRITDGSAPVSWVHVAGLSAFIPGLTSYVIGVGGGSLLGFRHRSRQRPLAVGPRSATPLDLSYSCFAQLEEIGRARAVARPLASRDSGRYIVLKAGRERRLGLTLTCAAYALGELPEGSRDTPQREAAVKAFERVGAAFGVNWERLARDMLQQAAIQIEQLVVRAMAGSQGRRPYVLGAGGAADIVVPLVARRLGLSWRVPRASEFTSSLGAAFSVTSAVEARATAAH
jgi:N-methylhydantoinase A